MNSLEFRLLKIQNFLFCALNSNKTTLLTSMEHSGRKCFGTCVKIPPETALLNCQDCFLLMFVKGSWRTSKHNSLISLILSLLFLRLSSPFFANHGKREASRNPRTILLYEDPAHSHPTAVLCRTVSEQPEGDAPTPCSEMTVGAFMIS